jgi:two-component system response regulator HydG
MPPLRERRNDIPILAKHFLRYFAGEQKKSLAEFSPDAMRSLLNHGWPGNVRELQNTIEHATVLAKSGPIEAADLPSTLHQSHFPSKTSGSLVTLVDNEKNLLIKALEQCGWNKKETAKRLGISRNTLYMKMKKHQIPHPTAH